MSNNTEARIVLTAQDNTRAAFESAKAGFGNLTAAGDKFASSAGMLLGAGGVAGLTGLVALGVQISKDIDAFNDLADTTGASVENISALDRIARETGGSIDTISGSLVKFNKALSDAKPDNEQGTVFKRLGLDVAELKALDPAEALLKTAQAFQAFKIDGDLARDAQTLFGKSIAEVAPFLKDLAEAGHLSATVTKEQAEEAEKFNKELYKLKANTVDMHRAFVSDLVTGLNASFKAFRETREESNLFYSSLVAIQTLLGGDARHQQDKKLTEDTEALLFAENALLAQRAQGYAEDSRVIKNTKEKIASLKAEIAVTQDARKAYEKLQAVAAPDEKPSIGPAPDTTKKKKGPALDLTNKGILSYLDSLQKTVDKTQNLTAVESALLELRRNGTGVSLNTAADIIRLAEQIDKEKELSEELKLRRAEATAAGDAVNKANEKYQGRLESLLGATPTAEFNRRQEDLAILQNELEAGRIQTEQYAEAVAARFGLIGEEVKKTKSFAEDMGLAFNSAFEDAILSGKGLSDVLVALGRDIERIILRKTITEPVGNWVTSKITSLFGFADGGDPPVGTPYLVGERGPELRIDKSPGTIIPNHRLAGLGGATYNINNYMTVGNVASSDEVDRKMHAATLKAVGVIRRSVAYGGANG